MDFHGNAEKQKTTSCGAMLVEKTPVITVGSGYRR